MNQLEDKMDRRLCRAESDIADLKEKVDFFVQTQTPPLQGVFYEGQLWDACSLVEKLIGRAKKDILLIDSWVGPGTLDMLAKKRKGVKVEIVSSPRGNKLAQSDVDKFNAQYCRRMMLVRLRGVFRLGGRCGAPYRQRGVEKY